MPLSTLCRPRLVTLYILCGFMVWMMPLWKGWLDSSRHLHRTDWFKTEWKAWLANLSISLSKSPQVFRNPPISSQSFSEESEHTWKTILFWNKWFGHEWSARFGPTTPEELRILGCPSWRCKFSTNHRDLFTADAVVFEASGLQGYLKNIPRPNFQRWVWVAVESPISDMGRTYSNSAGKMSPFINWTMTYHSGSDIMAFYGHFLSRDATVRPLRPNLMSEHSAAVQKVQAALDRGDTLQDVMGDSWRHFVERPRVVAFMTSHCFTYSRREDYVDELQKYIKVDRYGSCLQRKCGNRHQPITCWENILSKNYSFYMAMENSLCNEYVTEKLYFALVYRMVPVVWGGSEYDKVLPPHSYINARHYHPRDLAAFLLRLRQDPVAYGRYHLWRGYLKAVMGGSFCEMCHRLHTDTEPSRHKNIGKWFGKSGNCTRVAKGMFASDAWKKYINSTTTGSNGPGQQDTANRGTKQQYIKGKGTREGGSESKGTKQNDIKSKGTREKDSKSKGTKQNDIKSKGTKEKDSKSKGTKQNDTTSKGTRKKDKSDDR
ncbi:alpha-(1,3)-fucosyltransferase C-like [Portunus trituberculatus]|uniref:alpha-(1,3)-fucosyltransferase C-like n=1 Tax=Portunus trituberculatus TaxID=210409 RepID=UPI001E1D1A20|nr:alpha-(1,3)-fucosyltransferase C-like [Portunus trituberculatus]